MRGAIKPNTQVKILSKEHSMYVQELAFNSGFKWCSSNLDFIHVPVGEYIKFRANFCMAFSVRKNGFDEVFIDPPKPSIESKILAEKINSIKGEHGPELTFDHQGVYKLFNHPEADAICNAMVNKEPQSTASDILNAAKDHLDERARIYDRPEGERSISSVVEAFNALTGDGLMNSDERGWMFMVLLKLSRSQQGSFKLDNYEDGVNYFALMGESASALDKKDKL